ncbi:Conserved_hypothetical protein [Hexamita inflata]|uniref:Uncharacterized protein n=1 Tax=Hexamita inflata TaxID=28002 RepID=A0AA86PYH7_9EUKA|nr:Conserved hypothetical protein [Hexamita inflata]
MNGLNIGLHDSSAQKQPKKPRKVSMFAKQMGGSHFPEPVKVDLNYQQDYKVPVVQRQNNPEPIIRSFDENNNYSNVQVQELIAQVEYLSQNARASSISTSNAALSLLNNIYNSLLSSQMFLTTEQKNTPIDSKIAIQVLNKIHQLPTTMIDEDTIRIDCPLESIFIQLQQKKTRKHQYANALQLLCSIILQDDGYIVEQLNLYQDVTSFLNIGEFQISLLQLNLLQIIIPLINEADEDEKVLIFLIIEKYLIGIHQKDAENSNEQYINSKHLIDLFQKEIVMQIHDLKNKGFVFNGCGRIALRTLTACGYQVNSEGCISILLKNYNDDQKSEYLHLILLFVCNFSKTVDQNSYGQLLLENEDIQILIEYLQQNNNFDDSEQSELLLKCCYCIKSSKEDLNIDKNQIFSFSHPFLCYYSEQQQQYENNYGTYPSEITQYLQQIGLNKFKINDLGVSYTNYQLLVNQQVQIDHSIKYFMRRNNNLKYLNKQLQLMLKKNIQINNVQILQFDSLMYQIQYIPNKIQYQDIIVEQFQTQPLNIQQLAVMLELIADLRPKNMRFENFKKLEISSNTEILNQKLQFQFFKDFVQVILGKIEIEEPYLNQECLELLIQIDHQFGGIHQQYLRRRMK